MSGRVGRQQPVYLILDVADGSAEKRDIVENALPRVRDVVRNEPAAFSDLRLALLFFNDQPIVPLGLSDLTQLEKIPRPPYGQGRNWHRVFRILLSQIEADGAPFRPLHLPVVLFIVDGPPDDKPEQWRAELNKLVAGAHPIVHLIGYGSAPEGLLDEVVRTVGNGSRRVPDSQHPLDAIANTVLDLRGKQYSALAKPLARQVVSMLRTPDVSAPPPPQATSPKPMDQTTAVQDVPVALLPPLQDPPEPGASALSSPAQEPLARSMSPPEPSGRGWKGGFTPYAVGDTGRAAAVVRPAPDRAEWRVPDTILDGVHTPDEAGLTSVELRAASVRGLSHRHYGKVRQDHYAFCITPNGRYLVVSVSDGVSAATQSQQAARTVCLSGCAGIMHQLNGLSPGKLDWQLLVYELADRLTAQAGQLAGADEGTFTPNDAAATHAATALFAVVDLEPVLGSLPVQVFSIGDSPAWVLRNGTEWQSLQAIKNEGAVVASSRTRALPLLGRELDPAVSTTLGPTDVLVLMTDGIADPLGDGRGDVGRFLAEVWARPPAPLDFAAQVDFARKTHDDDRTAVAIWPAGLG